VSTPPVVLNPPISGAAQPTSVSFLKAFTLTVSALASGEVVTVYGAIRSSIASNVEALWTRLAVLEASSQVARIDLPAGKLAYHSTAASPSSVVVAADNTNTNLTPSGTPTILTPPSGGAPSATTTGQGSVYADSLVDGEEVTVYYTNDVSADGTNPLTWAILGVANRANGTLTVPANPSNPNPQLAYLSNLGSSVAQLTFEALPTSNPVAVTAPTQTAANVASASPTNGTMLSSTPLVFNFTNLAPNQTYAVIARYVGTATTAGHSVVFGPLGAPNTVMASGGGSASVSVTPQFISTGTAALSAGDLSSLVTVTLVPD
jgi:hypothetical protein